MKATISLISPAGVPVTIEIGISADPTLALDLFNRAAQIGHAALEAGWSAAPTVDHAQGPAAAELAQGPTFAGYPCSPTVDDRGLPTWIIVDGLQAIRREKQGDVWYSAKVGDGQYTQVLRIPKGEKPPEVRGL